MAASSATCALSITPETLSAWRDKQVKATTATQLDRHVPTCAACQRELAQFEMVARALYRQRELVPGNRVWHGVAAQINGRRQSRVHLNPRTLMSGIGGVVVVLLLGFFFARVLGGSGKGTSPIATVVTTALPATTTPAPTPTVTGSATPTINTVTIAQAWGANAAKQTLTTPGDATHVFQAQNITHDDTVLLGDEVTFNPSGNADPSNVVAGFLDIATRQFTDIGVAHGGGMGHPGCCTTDGQFLVAEDSDQPGATGGSFHERFWSYDTQTPSQPAHIVATGGQFQGINTSAFDHGMLILYTGTGFQFENLITQHNTPMVLPGSDQPSIYIASFTWPYLVYAATNVTTTNTTGTVYIYDVATSTATLTLPNATDAIISGDTLFYTATNGNLFEMDHFTTPDAQSHLLAPAPGKLLGASDRLILTTDAGSNYIAWDRTEHRFVQLTTPPPQSSTAGMSAALSGNLLMITSASSTYAPQQVAIYDTSHLPTHG